MYGPVRTVLWEDGPQNGGPPTRRAGAVGDQAATDELRELRRRVADLQLENDILKKAAVILGTKPHSKRVR